MNTENNRQYVTDPEKYAQYIAKQAERCDATFRLAVSHEGGNQLSNEVLKLRGDLIETKAHAQRLAEALQSLLEIIPLEYRTIKANKALAELRAAQ